MEKVNHVLEFTPENIANVLRQRYRRKIRGWYSKQEYEDKAVKRMSR